MRKLIVILALSTISYTHAGEFCADQYSDQITKVDAELGSLVSRQSKIDGRLAEIFTDQSKLSSDLAAAAIRVPPDIVLIGKLGQQMATLDREKVKLQSEGYGILDRVVALKGKIPAELQGKLRGCAEASAPTNLLVNLTIQTIAALSTGGASLLLPPKALYVDMSAVLNGYPTGGPNSVINEAREAALKALPGGLGNPRNDVGKIIRDPGRVIRCLFGC